MDSVQADNLFHSEILSRWPEFDLSGALLQDWLSLFKKHQPEDVKRAAAQYVLNYDSYKKPALNKFKEVLNAIAASRCEKKPSHLPDYPHYFLQSNSGDSTVWAFGTFTQIFPVADNPDFAMKIMQQEKKRYEELYGGIFNIVICNNQAEFGLLVKDRAEKRLQKASEK